MPLDLALLPDKPLISLRTKKLFASAETSGDEAGDWLQLESNTFNDLKTRGKIRKDIEFKDLSKKPQEYDEVARAYIDDLKSTFGMPDDETAALWSYRPGWYKKHGGKIENIPDDAKGSFDKTGKEVMQTRFNNINSFLKSSGEKERFDIGSLNPFQVKEAEAAESKFNLDLLPDKPQATNKFNFDLLPDKPKPPSITGLKAITSLGTKAIEGLSKLSKTEIPYELAQPAFKYGVMTKLEGVPEDEAVQKAETYSWADVITAANPEYYDTAQGTPLKTFLKHFPAEIGGEILDFGSRPSSYIFWGAMERLGPKALEGTLRYLSVKNPKLYTTLTSDIKIPKGLQQTVNRIRGEVAGVKFRVKKAFGVEQPTDLTYLQDAETLQMWKDKKLTATQVRQMLSPKERIKWFNEEFTKRATPETQAPKVKPIPKTKPEAPIAPLDSTGKPIGTVVGHDLKTGLPIIDRTPLPTPVKPTETTPKPEDLSILKQPPKEDVSVDPLIAEARKYKTAEEFVKANYNTELEDYELVKNWIKQNTPKQSMSGHGPLKEVSEKIRKGNIPKNVLEAMHRVFEPTLDRETGERLDWSNPDYPRTGTLMDFADAYSNLDIIYSKEGLMTQSQLTDIWNQAQAKAEGKKLSPTEGETVEIVRPKAEPIVEGIEPLITEAKKYKTAEEFVESKYIPQWQQKDGTRFNEETQIFDRDAVSPFKTGHPTKIRAYHGSRTDIIEFNEKARGSSTGAPSAKEATFFTEDVDTAKDYAFASPWLSTTGEGFGDPKAREYFIEMNNPFVKDYSGKSYRDKSYKSIIDKAKKLGHDGVIFKNTKDPGQGSSEDARRINVYAMFDNSKIKTKQQLTDIWNEANKPEGKKADLTEEAKKYKTAEEFVKAQTIKKGIRVEAPAIKTSQGKVYTGTTHSEALEKAKQKGEIIEKETGKFEGDSKFYDKNGNEISIDFDLFKIDISDLPADKKTRMIDILGKDLIADRLSTYDILGVTSGEGIETTKSQLTDIWNKAHEKAKPKKQTLISTIKSAGGIDAKGVQERFNWKVDIQENKIPLTVFKKGGLPIDVMAQELQSTGVLKVPENMNPVDYLMEQLKNVQARNAELQADKLDSEYEKEYNKWLEKRKEEGYEEGEIKQAERELEADIKEEVEGEVAKEEIPEPSIEEKLFDIEPTIPKTPLRPKIDQVERKDLLELGKEPSKEKQLDFTKLPDKPKLPRANVIKEEIRKAELCLKAAPPKSERWVLNQKIADLNRELKELTSTAKDVSIKKSYQSGKIAFDKGIKRTPMMDKDFMATLEGGEVGSSTPLMEAWYKGWDEANLRPSGGSAGGAAAAVSAQGQGYGGIIEPSNKSSKVKVAKSDYAKISEEVPSREETNIIKETLKITSPANVSEQARVGALTLRKNLAELARKDVLAIELLKKAHSAFTWMNDKDAHKFMDNIEEGLSQGNSKLQPFADTMRGLLDERRTAIQQLGKGQLEAYYENYFPHIWKDPNNAKNVIMQIMGRKRLEGTKSFLKKRVIVSIKDGLARGLELVSDNPVDLVLLKLHEMDRYIMAQNMIRGLKEKGLIKFVYSRAKTPDGYTRINDNAFTVFMPPEITKKEAYDSILVDQLMDIAKGLGIDTKRFVSIGGKRWGYAQNIAQGVVRTKYAGPESVLAHEIGHILGFRYDVYNLIGRRKEGEFKVHEKGKKAGQEYFKPTKEAVEYRRDIDKQWRALADARWKGLKASPGYKNYVRNSKEKEAVLVEALIHAPEEFKKVAPDLYSGFVKFINAHGELRPLLDVKPSLVLGEADAKIKVPGFTTLGYYCAPQDVARLINNHLSPGLRNADNKLISGSYNILRGVGNVLNQINLSLSGFHAINVSMDMMGSTVGLGIRKLGTKGQAIGGLMDILTYPFAPIKGIWEGTRVRKAYRTQMESIKDPKLRKMVEALVTGGGRDRLDVYYYNRQVKALQKTFSEIIKGKDIQKLIGIAKLPFNIFGATVEVLAKPIMEWYVPTGKLGLFSKLAQHEMMRAESGEITDEQLPDRLASVWDSIDNRMGQLIYDNLFWNKTMKDGLMLAIRSVGWNLGSWREFAGAGVDLVTVNDRIKRGDKFFSQKMSYVVGVGIVYATIGGIIHYLLTGKRPEGPKDLYFPRTSRKNPDGSDERLSLPAYSKDVYAYSQRPVQTIKNKAHPLIGLMNEQIKNEDFYNIQIANPNDPIFNQIMERAQHIKDYSKPFSFKNYEKMKQAGEEKGLVAFVSITGITAAPSYVTRSAAQKLMYRYIAEKIPDATRTKEEGERSEYRRTLKNRLRKGETIDREEALQILGVDSYKRALKEAQIPPFSEAFKRLSIDEALNVYSIATKKEKEQSREILFDKYINALKRGKVTQDIKELYKEILTDEGRLKR